MANETKTADLTQQLSSNDHNQRPQAKAYLGNNPRCQLLPWRHPDTGEVDEAESVPSLVVDFLHLPCNGEWDISATVIDGNGKKIISLVSSASSSNGQIHHSWHLDAPFLDPFSIRLTATQGSFAFEEITSLRIYQLAGRVTDFSGKPLKATVHANGLEGVATLTDDDGRYTLWLPDIRMRALQAYDAEYGRTNIETWIYDYRPKGDLNLDIRIGQIEIYELQAWRGYLGVKLDFIPMSVAYVLRCLESSAKGKGKFAPAFNQDDIAVMADDVQARIMSINRRELEFFGRDVPADFTPPDPQDEYSVQAAVPDSSPGAERGSLQVVKVVLKHEENGIIERGEAFYLGLTNGCGIDGGYEY